MSKTKYLFLFLCSTIAFTSGRTQTIDNLHLSRIIFHSSRCNGTCPQIDLQIDSNKNTFVKRAYFKTKSKTDKRFSGQFKGALKQVDYNKLIRLLQYCHIDTLKFPNVSCCDGVITTIIVYYNGQRKYLKSMTPPVEANQLISFLYKLGDDKSLQKTGETKHIEE